MHEGVGLGVHRGYVELMFEDKCGVIRGEDGVEVRERRKYDKSEV